MSAGADYAFWPTPGKWASAEWIAALKAHGIRFAGRYVSQNPANDGNGKNLTLAEFRALHAAGLPVLLYAEEGSGWMRGGHSAGLAAARHFDAVTKALGMTGAVMICAADWDVDGASGRGYSAPHAEQDLVHACLDGAADVLGRARVGLYGGFWAVWRAMNAGKTSHAVQTYAWSSYHGGPLPPHSAKWQVGGGLFLADTRAGVQQGQTFGMDGAELDRLTSFKDDYGQWPRPAGYHTHVTEHGNLLSLAAVAASRGTTIAHIRDLSEQHLGPGRAAVLTAYLTLDTAMVAAGLPRPAMPEGLAYCTTNP